MSHSYPKYLLAAGYGANGMAFWDWRKSLGAAEHVQEASAAE